MNILHTAVLFGHFRIVEYLLKYMDPHTDFQEAKKTTLHVAALMGHLDVLKLLLDTAFRLFEENGTPKAKQAFFSKKTEFGDTALSLARKEKHLHVVAVSSRSLRIFHGYNLFAYNIVSSKGGKGIGGPHLNPQGVI